MLLGQPTVAKMRECLSKLEVAQLCGLGGLDAGVQALEELEYYAEDLDNAVDLVKIGGLGVMRRCCAFGLLQEADAAGGTEVAADDAEALTAAEAAVAKASPEDCSALREGACGVLAAMLQNQPTVVRAARNRGIHALLLGLIIGGGDSGATSDNGMFGLDLPVVRKALLALSALLRTSATCGDEDDEPEAGAGAARTLSASAADASAAEAAAARTASGAAAATAAAVLGAGDAAAATARRTKAEAVLTMCLPTLCPLIAHSDLKLRRRALFLLASLATDEAADALAVARALAEGDDGLLEKLLAALRDPDEDVRTQSTRLLIAVQTNSTAATGATVAAGAATAMVAALAQRLGGAGGVVALQQALQRARDEHGEPEELARLSSMLKWLSAS